MISQNSQVITRCRCTFSEPRHLQSFSLKNTVSNNQGEFDVETNNTFKRKFYVSAVAGSDLVIKNMAKMIFMLPFTT